MRAMMNSALPSSGSNPMSRADRRDRAVDVQRQRPAARLLPRREHALDRRESSARARRRARARAPSAAVATRAGRWCGSGGRTPAAVASASKPSQDQRSAASGVRRALAHVRQALLEEAHAASRCRRRGRCRSRGRPPRRRREAAHRSSRRSAPRASTAASRRGRSTTPAPRRTACRSSASAARPAESGRSPRRTTGGPSTRRPGSRGSGSCSARCG